MLAYADVCVVVEVLDASGVPTGVAATTRFRLVGNLYVSIRQNMSAYVSTRQHTSAYVSLHFRLFGSFGNFCLCIYMY